jgi:hypothetical protein
MHCGNSEKETLMSSHGNGFDESLSKIAGWVRPYPITPGPLTPVPITPGPGGASPSAAAQTPPLTIMPVPLITPHDLAEMQSELPQLIQILRTASQPAVRSSLFSGIDALKQSELRSPLSAEREERLNVLANAMIEDVRGPRAERFAPVLGAIAAAGLYIAATSLSYTVFKDHWQ